MNAKDPVGIKKTKTSYLITGYSQYGASIYCDDEISAQAVLNLIRRERALLCQLEDKCKHSTTKKS